MYLLACHAFLRIGEITQSDPKVQNNLAFHAVKFLLANSRDPYAFEINLEKFKHHTGVSDRHHSMICIRCSDIPINPTVIAVLFLCGNCGPYNLWDYS
jgi:hypothetical protein